MPPRPEPTLIQRLIALMGGTQPTMIRHRSPYHPDSPGEYRPPTYQSLGDTVYVDPNAYTDPGTGQVSSPEVVEMHELGHRLYQQGPPGVHHIMEPWNPGDTEGFARIVEDVLPQWSTSSGPGRSTSNLESRANMKKFLLDQPAFQGVAMSAAAQKPDNTRALAVKRKK